MLEFGGVRLLTDPTFDPAGGEYPSDAESPHAFGVAADRKA